MLRPVMVMSTSTSLTIARAACGQAVITPFMSSR
jgi:hypothetical protein